MNAKRSENLVLLASPSKQWLDPLPGVGIILLMEGLLTKEMTSVHSVKGLGRGAASVRWRLGALAAVMYLVLLALAIAFDDMISNLPSM